MVKKEINIFFAKNKKQAESYLKKVSDKEDVDWCCPRLAKKQLNPVGGWKTWTFQKSKGKSKCKCRKR